MEREHRIANKVISKKSILEVAKYLESIKNEYYIKFKDIEISNRNLQSEEEIYGYNGLNCKVDYCIIFKDGQNFIESDYEWFEKNIENARYINSLELYCVISYVSDLGGVNQILYTDMRIWLKFQEELAILTIDGEGLEEEFNNVYQEIVKILDKNEARYSKTIKNRNIRIQSFCLALGFLLSYIIYFILKGMEANLPSFIQHFLTNKNILIFGQWILASLVGNLCGNTVMMTFYKNILPHSRFSYYNINSRKAFFVDDVRNYIALSEVQIGKFHENVKNRLLIERLYIISLIIVLIQLVLSIIFYFVL